MRLKVEVDEDNKSGNVFGSSAAMWRGYLVTDIGSATLVRIYTVWTLYNSEYFRNEKFYKSFECFICVKLSTVIRSSSGLD